MDDERDKLSVDGLVPIVRQMCSFDVHDRLEAAQFVEERQNLVHDDLLAKSDVVIIAVSDQSLNVVRHDFCLLFRDVMYRLLGDGGESFPDGGAECGERLHVFIRHHEECPFEIVDFMKFHDTIRRH
jgi:hypothetical protein